MKLTIDNKALAAALKKLQPITSGKVTLPVLSCVLMRAEKGLLRLAATDLDTALEITLPCVGIDKEGALGVPLRKLLSVLGGIPTSDVVIERKGDAGTPVQVSGGDRTAKIFSMPAEEFPPIDPIVTGEHVATMPDTLSVWLRRLLPAVSNEETRYVLCGVSFIKENGKLTLFATDSRRLHVIDTEMEWLGDTMILPTVALQLLVDMMDGQECMLRKGNLVEFSAEGWRLVSKTIEGNPPSFRQVIPATTKGKVLLPKAQTLAALDFACTMTSDKSFSVKMEAHKEVVKFTANTPEVGDACAQVVPDKGSDSITIAFNPDFFRQMLKACSGDTARVEYVDDYSPLVLRDGLFTGVVMPMRIS